MDDSLIVQLNYVSTLDEAKALVRKEVEGVLDELGELLEIQGDQKAESAFYACMSIIRQRLLAAKAP